MKFYIITRSRGHNRSATNIKTVFPKKIFAFLFHFAFNFRMDEEPSVASGGVFIIKDPAQLSGTGEVRPRARPKPKIKSQTVSGIALPGLAEVLSKKKIAAEDKVC